jgi:hypothetical protein
MKLKSLAALVLTATVSFAHAGGMLATMNNTMGGRIELTNIPCGAKGDGWMAHAFAMNGTVPDLLGCWNSYDENNSTISIIWTYANRSKEMRTYRTADFTRTRYGMNDANWAPMNNQ